MTDTTVPNSPLMDVLRDPLPTTTTDRLRRIARLLRADDNRWEQSTWINVGAKRDHSKLSSQADGPVFAASIDRFDCGTTACLCGWACLLTPPDELLALPEAQIYENWENTGAVLLGLKCSPGTDYNSLAARLFRGDLDEELEPWDVADILDLLADIPEADRHWDEFLRLHPSQAQQVYGR